MKVFAHHDAKGNIRSLVSFQGPEGIRIGLIPKSDVSISEVEGIKLESKENDLEKLSEIARDHRIVTTAKSATLEKQGNPTK